jgi:hypothetical protein
MFRRAVAAPGLVGFIIAQPLFLPLLSGLYPVASFTRLIFENAVKWPTT